jgi:hypothetical protein
MPNRSIYIRPADLPTWEAAKAKAKRLGISMSQVIETGIRTWVHKREREIALGIYKPANEKQAAGRMRRVE